MMIEAAHRGAVDAQAFMAEIYRQSGDETLAVVWEVVASVFDDEKEHAVSSSDTLVSKYDLESTRHTLQRVKAYMLLVDCDDPQLMQLADLMRDNFQEEV